MRNLKVKCYKCEKLFIIEKKSNSGKYFCDKSCANSRSWTEKQKEEKSISIIGKLGNSSKIIYKKCIECEKIFIKKDLEKFRKQKFCSVSCNTTYNNKKRKDNKIFKYKRKEYNGNEKTYIYKLEYPVGNIRYVGKSNDPEKRLVRQIKEAKRRNKNKRDKWINSLISENNYPIMNIIEKVNYSEWQDREVYWIKHFKNKGCDLVNGTKGGEGSNGFKGKSHSEKTKKLISEKIKKKYLNGEINIKNGEDIKSSKLTEIEVREIRNKYKNKETSYLKLSKEYGTSKQNIGRIIKRITWKHVE